MVTEVVNIPAEETGPTLARFPLRDIRVDDSLNLRDAHVGYRDIDKLAASIEHQGLIQPLGLAYIGDDPKPTLMSGFRRIKALYLLADKAKPESEKHNPLVACQVARYQTRDEAMMANLASDTGTDPPRNVDLAARYFYLHDRFGTPLVRLAKMTSRDKATVSRLVSTYQGLCKEIREAWMACPPDQEYPLARLHKWSKETPAVQKKAFAAYQAGDTEAVEVDDDGEDGDGEGGEGGEGRRVDGKKPGKKAVYAELERIKEKLEAKPGKEEKARLDGMSKALRWGLGEITRLH